MLRAPGLLGLSICITLCLTACGRHVLGEKAPEFGSSSNLSTTAGFLKGTWKMRRDDSTSAHQRVMIAGLAPSLFLEFHPDHTCREYGHGNDIHMSWSESSSGIDLTVLDVDGYDPAAINAGSEAEHSAHQTSHSRRFARTEMSSRALSLLAATKRLELMPDKKRLFNPASVDATGHSRAGTEIWERVE